MKIYTYDHCPYCVRARFAFGVKGIPFEHIVLLNDDEETPIGFVGAKMVPILIRQDGAPMPESMDIVHYGDALEGERLFGGGGDRTALDAWIEETAMLMRELLFPRWVNAPLPEFATEPARAYFTRKKTETIGDFGEALARTSELQPQMEAALLKLEPLIQSPEGFHGTLSIDDVDLFARLRGLALVKDLAIPPKVRAYIDTMAALGKIPLHEEMAS
jgi:glutaredoxin 2